MPGGGGRANERGKPHETIFGLTAELAKGSMILEDDGVGNLTTFVAIHRVIFWFPTIKNRNEGSLTSHMKDESSKQNMELLKHLGFFVTGLAIC